MKDMDVSHWQIKDGRIEAVAEQSEEIDIPEGIREIAPFALAEHREMLELVLPDSLKKIGAHAFYNCRSLVQVSFSDALDDIGDGAFKNCEKIKRLIVRRKSGRMRGLKDILSDLHQEIEVRIAGENGQEEARLVFPYYIMNYEENTPARIVNQIAEGSGVEYRNCISSGGIDFLFYDRLFDSNIAVDLKEASARIAMARLLFPVSLTQKAEEQYREYLLAHARGIVRQMIDADREQDVMDFLNLTLTDHAFLTETIEYARAGGHSQALSALLNYERSRFGRQRKSYDFF